MAKKLKRLYAVHCMTKLSLGLQYVKANTLADAKGKFKKRYPKLRILDAHWVQNPQSRNYNYAI